MCTKHFLWYTFIKQKSLIMKGFIVHDIKIEPFQRYDCEISISVIIYIIYYCTGCIYTPEALDAPTFCKN